MTTINIKTKVKKVSTQSFDTAKLDNWYRVRGGVGDSHIGILTTFKVSGILYRAFITPHGNVWYGNSIPNLEPIEQINLEVIDD